MQKIKKIGVVSLGKMIGITYAFLGLLFGAIFSLISLVGVSMSNNSEAGFGLVFGIGAIIMLPIIYGILGFISGIIGGAIYNVAARWVGGIEILVETVPVTQFPSSTSAPTNSITS